MAHKSKFGSISVRMALYFSLLLLAIEIITLGVSAMLSRKEAIDQLSEQLRGIVATAALQIDGDVHRTFDVAGVESQQAWRDIRDYLDQVRAVNNLEFDHLYTFQINDGEIESLKFAVMLHENPFVGDVYTPPERNVPLLTTAFQTGRPQVTGLYKDDHGEWISAFAPIKAADGTVAGLLQADYRIDQDNQAYIMAWANEFLPILVLFLLIAPIGFGLTYWIARSIVRPINHLALFTEYIAQDHWDHAVPPMKWDELERLGTSFERMRRTIRGQLEHLKTFNAQLETKVEERTEQLTIINNIIASVNEMTGFEDVLCRTGIAIHENLEVDALAVMLPLPAPEGSEVDEPLVEVYRLLIGHDDPNVKYTCEGVDQDMLHHILGTGDVDDDAIAKQLAKRFLPCDCLAFVCLGLRVRDEALGAVLFGRRTAEISNQSKDSLLSLSTHLAAAIEKTRLIDSLSELNQEIQQAQEALRQQSQAQIEYEKTHDSLTGLGNRSFFSDRVALDVAKTVGAEKMAVVVLDLDRFKKINDSLGVEAGDRVLFDVAKRLSAQIEEKDTLARISGNEFALLLPKLFMEQDARCIAEKYLEVMTQPFYHGRVPVHLSASIGIATFPSDCSSGQNLLNHAQIALSRAKLEGGNQLKFFNAEMNTSSERRLILESALREALDNEELFIVYQPQVSIKDEQLVGFEALLRWVHPELGFVSPGEFIPVAEEAGLIVPIGRWVTRRVCRQLRAWQDEGLNVKPVGVNLSARQFQEADLAEFVRDVLAETGIPSHLLELEITEGIAIVDVKTTIKTLLELKMLGITVALDDFGTGYSSLSYLRQYELDRLKIDRSFVMELPDNGEAAAIARAIIDMGHALDLKVIAEGVEDDRQRQFLAEHGCDEIQGYFFSPPKPSEEARDFLTMDRVLPAKERPQKTKSA